MSQVHIIRGEYRSRSVSGTFRLYKPLKKRNRDPFLTVFNDGRFHDGGEHCRIRVKTSADFEYLSGTTVTVPQGLVTFTPSEYTPDDHFESTDLSETDDEAMDRIAQRFSVLDQMSAATINGDIRALIVSGPPGIGKSFGVEQQMEKATIFDRLADRKVRYQVVKGAMTPLGLYAQLYKFSDHKNVLVFDDSDGVFSDELSLNILKAALDSGKRRKIFWNSDSSMLRREGIPESFDFNGGVIFITNLNFANTKSKKLQDHLSALQSRCHYIDLTVNSQRDLVLRIKQVHRDADGGLFVNYYFENDEADQIFEFMWENKSSLRELSLRMCLKIADLVKISPNNWKTLAKATVCHN